MEQTESGGAYELVPPESPQHKIFLIPVIHSVQTTYPLSSCPGPQAAASHAVLWNQGAKHRPGTDKTAMDFRRPLPEIRWQSCLSPGSPGETSLSGFFEILTINSFIFNKYFRGGPDTYVPLSHPYTYSPGNFDCNALLSHVTGSPISAPASPSAFTVRFPCTPSILPGSNPRRISPA